MIADACDQLWVEALILSAYEYVSQQQCVLLQLQPAPPLALTTCGREYCTPMITTTVNTVHWSEVEP